VLPGLMKTSRRKSTRIVMMFNLSKSARPNRLKPGDH